MKMVNSAISFVSLPCTTMLQPS